jgi:hypothetical protein
MTQVAASSGPSAYLFDDGEDQSYKMNHPARNRS